jgi:hypothetical protein
MKRIGTVFFILSIFAVSANAQVIHTAIRGAVPYTKVPILNGGTPHVMHPLVAQADTVMGYFDPDSTGFFNWYFLPSHLTLSSGTGFDTQYVINRYAERFSLPKVGQWVTRYIDSVEVLFAPTTIATDGTNDSLIVELRPGLTLFEQPSGDTLFGFNTIAPPMDSFVINSQDLTQDQIYDTVIPFNYKLPASWGAGTNRVTLGSDFYVCLFATDTDINETQFAIRGDSVTFNPPLENPLTGSDQNLYRGMWALDNSTNPTYPYFENDYAGLQFTNQDQTQTDYFYTNFVIIAYMSNQLTNAVDANGKPQFVLEPIFPNPVATSTEIDYNLTQAGPVSLSVYNQLGEQVSSIVSEMQDAGGHSAIFKVGTLPNGIYYYKLQSGDFTATRTMIINR